MTVVAFANVVGQARGEPIPLCNRRRRLSTIVARHRPAGRRFIVSVHRNRAGEAVTQPSDATVRLRKNWVKTLVGPRDVVLITLLPSGGGGGGRGGKSGLGIGLAVASIALIALAPFAAPALAGSMLGLPGAASGALATALKTGFVIGGLALGAAAQLAANKTERQRTLYSVAGGGNVPRPGSRSKPLIYGRCWTVPPLSQRDYFRYDGDTMVLTKRMTLGLGRFQVHTIKVGDAVFWSESGGVQAPFNATRGDAASAAAVEVLYESASSIAVGDAISSGQVAGQELPRFDGNPSVTPWFRLTPQGVTATSALISRTYAQVFVIGSSSGQQKSNVAGALWRARRIDPVTGAVIGQPFDLLREDLGRVLITTAKRVSTLVRLPAEGAYEVCAYNLYTDPKEKGQNGVTWDELTAFKDDVRIRPKTTEIVMRVRAGPGLTITAFTDVSVEATRILPVWTGSAWVEQPTRKAVWALCDLTRNEYGLFAPNGFDVTKAFYDAGRLTAYDTFDGQLPEVSSYWEAASTILLPLRADPVKIGAVHSYVRDESTSAQRLVLTRRQIVRDSSSASFRVTGEGGDVIVEFDRDGDPRRPDEARYSYGAPTRTPKRYRVIGISEGGHAYIHAKWLALVSVFRGAGRTLTTEWDGRLIAPGDHVLSDLWFLKGKRVFGVEAANDNRLTVDVDANLPSTWSYGSIRSRNGREWGILQMRGQGARGIELDAGDVAALTAATGKGLADVLASDTQDPTTVVVGDLVELQETYVVRSAIPADQDHVRIEMLADDPRIWQLLGEPVSAPAPISVDALAEPLIPTISVLRGACQRIETGIEVTWSVAPARGARTYAIALSYDGGVTREPISNGAAVAGRAPVRQGEGTITLFAVAYGRTGLAGAEVSTTFSTVAPVVDGALVDVTRLPPLTYQNLDALLRGEVDKISPVVANLDKLRKALALDPAQRQGYVDPIIGDLRADLALLLASADRNQQALAELRGNLTTAGLEVIPGEGRARFYAIEALQSQVGSQVTNLSVSVDALKQKIELYGSVQAGNIDGLITQITTVTQTLNALQGTIATLATSAQFDTATARISTAEQRLDAQAASIVTKAEKATVDAQGVQIVQVKQSLDAALGVIAQSVQAVGSDQLDRALIPSTLTGLLGLFGEQLGGLQQHFARAESSIAANFDDAGRATAEINTRLVVFQADAAAQFVSTTKAVADANQALVETRSLYDAQFASGQASLSQLAQTVASSDSALSQRLDAYLVRLGTAEAAAATEVQARISGDSALSGRLDAFSARVGSVEAGVSSVQQAQANQTAAQASINQNLYARSDAGTAGARFGMSVVSAPEGVSVRLAAVASTAAGGAQRNAGYYLDLLSDGTSRFVVDANNFVLTANGGQTYPFQFDGTTLTVPSLRVTDKAILPGAVSDKYAPAVADFDPGQAVNTNDWREIPGTSIEINADELYTVIISGTARVTTAVTGNNNVYNNVSLQVGIGESGKLWSGVVIASSSIGAGGGTAANNSLGDSGIRSSPAYFELYAKGSKARFHLVYNYQGSANFSGKINYAGLKIQVTKR